MIGNLREFMGNNPSPNPDDKAGGMIKKRFFENFFMFLWASAPEQGNICRTFRHWSTSPTCYQ